MRKPFLLSWLLLFAASAFAQDATKALLEKLSNAPGPSGAEEAVRAIMVAEMKPQAQGIQYGC